MQHIVIVGGGTAGWLTAGILASRLNRRQSTNGIVTNQIGSHSEAQSAERSAIKISLVESPDVATVGVGEGTWPSMRSTLKQIGVSETQFIKECDVSLKQGTRFNGWLHGQQEYYYHPFSLPFGFNELNLAPYWQRVREKVSFADAVSSQGAICDRGLSAKSITTPEYAFDVNYGYHLDAGKFATFLANHCCNQLAVEHVSDHVESVTAHEDGSIKALELRQRGEFKGDLYIDCSGFRALLIGQHLDVPLKSVSNILFNDRALAVQVDHQKDGVIASTTGSTVLDAGWVWDIALNSRRGVGYVFSKQHQNKDDAWQQLKRYLLKTNAEQEVNKLTPKELQFSPGYRETPWRQNCVAIGLSAGFVEPLEASALVLVETSANALADYFPANKGDMNIVAKRFNAKINHHWQQIIDFLKLHYVLSQRDDSDYWLDHRQSMSIPDSLSESLQLWKHHAPWYQDAPRVDELFSSASFQYVLYGMDFETELSPIQQNVLFEIDRKAQMYFSENRRKTEQYLKQLPSNYDLNQKARSYGFQKI